MVFREKLMIKEESEKFYCKLRISKKAGKKLNERVWLSLSAALKCTSKLEMELEQLNEEKSLL